MESSFFGVVTITSLENVWSSDSIKNEQDNADFFLTENHIKIVHYPDCQQLIIWLPTDWISYQDMAILDHTTGKEIWRQEIRLVVSGSIQIILDTLPFEPGDLTIKITKKDGLQHIINLKKYPEGSYPEKPEIIPEIVPDENKPPIVYRDGFGNIIPDQDLILRENVYNALVRKFSRKVKYEDSGRSGTVIYIDGDKTLRFYSEMGGGNCLFYIGIPTRENWVKETGYSLGERDEIIQFVAENTLRDQTTSSGAYFEIEEDRWITFYKARP